MSMTICALATPPGQGGIATVRLSGQDAFTIADRVFVPIHAEKSIREARGYTALLGHYQLRGQLLDETIALIFRAPHSYTGEDVVELSVHGGQAMAQGLLEALCLAGAQPAEGGAFTRRALENGRMSLTQAEAVMEIVSAQGRQGAALAQSALSGRLGRQIEALRASLEEVSAHIAAWMDYPEEDVPALSAPALHRFFSEQKAKLDALIDGYGGGAALRHGVDCVLAGRPNVGKSTILNLLAGFDRAIVFDKPGTTRDILEQQVVLQPMGLHINLFDTAGLRGFGGADSDSSFRNAEPSAERCGTGGTENAIDAVEAEGIRRSRRKMEQAGLVLAVFDAAVPLTGEDIELAQTCQGGRALAILNKRDLANDEALKKNTAALQPYFARILPLCAKDEAELPALSQAIACAVGAAKVDPEAAALCSSRQFAAALRARDALADALRAVDDGPYLDAAAVCLADAQQALADLSGQNASEATLDAVFANFCVGK